MLKHFVVKQLPMIAILILVSFLMLWRLGEAHLTNWDEAWYADIARNMTETGNLLTPIWNNQPFYDKPPLFYWLTAFGMKLFGVSEFSARFISAMSSIATIVVVYMFALNQWGVNTAVISSLVLLSTPAFLYRGRTGNLDSLLAFLIFASIFVFFKATKDKRWWLVYGILLGLTFLTKGMLTFLFPVIVLCMFFDKRKHKNRPIFLFSSMGLAIGIIALWFFITHLANGDIYIRQFFIHQREKVISTQSILQNFSWEYVTYLKSGMKVWFILLLPSLLYVWVRLRKSSLFLLSIYFIILLALWSVVEVKSNWFLLPLYPLASIFIGFSSVEFVKKYRKGYLGALLLVLLIAGFQLYTYRYEYIVPDVAADEARVAQVSKQLTQSDDIVYLTHYYYPTAVYYSKRKTYAVYGENPSVSWWILPKSAWEEILTRDRVFINTSLEDLKGLERQFPHVRFDILFQSGDKLLVKKST